MSVVTSITAPIAVAHGDGIGPEIMEAVLEVLKAAGAAVEPVPLVLGRAAYEAGARAGVAEGAWEVLAGTRALLKGPLETPRGAGYKSVNVTLRKTLGLFANVRPCRALAPFVPSRWPELDLVVVRENEEDLYAGIEHRQTDEVEQCLKLITRPGCERVARYALELARASGRRRVTCMVKDNIMKRTDGLFRRVFEELAADYPDLETETWIVDAGAAALVDRPERFDVLLLPNLYGDILSDVAAQMTGSLGLAPSANVGARGAMFEAIHGTAPDLAGRDAANPSGLLLAAVLLLEHLGQHDVADRIHDAWLRTLEDGVVTADLAARREGARVVGTRAFAQACVDRLGLAPRHLARRPRPLSPAAPLTTSPAAARSRKELVGVDLFLDAPGAAPEALARALTRAAGPALALRMITNRGVKVWPDGHPDTACTDHWRCRFEAPAGALAPQAEVLGLPARVAGQGLEPIKTEHLYRFDGEPGYSLGQGQ